MREVAGGRGRAEGAGGRGAVEKKRQNRARSCIANAEANQPAEVRGRRRDARSRPQVLMFAAVCLPACLSGGKAPPDSPAAASIIRPLWVLIGRRRASHPLVLTV